jgi:hypothetical protein
VDEVKGLSFNLIHAISQSLRILSDSQLRESIHKWLSPPDPSTNHNIACGTYQKTTASWFFQGSIFQEWKLTGSLLWVHGKRLPRNLFSLITPDAILDCSWLGQEHSLVRRVLIALVGDDRPLLSAPR